MSNLNRPTGWDEQPSEDAEWTPTRGMIRAAIWGGITAAVLIAVTAPLAVYLPTLAFQLYVRSALAFGVAWILFGVVQRAAGMAGWPCTLLAVALALGVMVSHFIVLGMTGGLTTSGGTPLSLAILLVEAGPTVAILCCAALCHRGGSSITTVADIVMTNIFTGRR